MMPCTHLYCSKPCHKSVATEHQMFCEHIFLYPDPSISQLQMDYTLLRPSVAVCNPSAAVVYLGLGTRLLGKGVKT